MKRILKDAIVTRVYFMESGKNYSLMIVNIFIAKPQVIGQL